MPSIPSNTGVVIVDHGSKRGAANAMLNDVVAMFRETTGAKIVEPAHMELAAPTIADAIGACVQQGAQTIVVHPYFLAPGRHSTEDIPRMVAEAAAAHPNVPCRVTEPLGLDERMCAVIAARIAETLNRSTVG
jgi:sirohydrochlorin ferrochelatase